MYNNIEVIAMPLTWEELHEYSNKNIDIGENCDVLEVDCKNIIYFLNNCEITIPENNRFFVTINCGGIQGLVYKKRIELLFENGMDESCISLGKETAAYTGCYDFAHTTAEWESVVKLGIAGLRKRIDEYAKNNKDAKKERFYNEIAKVYDAALLFMKRVASVAASQNKHEMAEGLLNLTEKAPGNLYEAMQTIIVYYVLQHMFETTALRTLGRLDSLLYPFFKKEKESDARELIFDFFKEIDSIRAIANIPFAIGGTDVLGNSLINELSYILLDTYEKAQTTDTKLHILCSDNIPTDIIEKAFKAVRNGNNSIVFMSDKKIIESLVKMGTDYEDAVDYHVVGCYECGGNGEITCSCNAIVNIPKALELALNNGRDMLTNQLVGLENDGNFESFEDLYNEFERQLEHLSKCAMKATDIYEANYKKMHSAPFLSGTYTSALENGGDIYCDYSAKYNNSSVNAIGLATAVDSLVAIRKAVFEDKILSIKELKETLKSNWEGREPLRLLIKNKFPKFGQGDKKTDIVAKNIADKLSETISGKPNMKGGQYRLGLFSINWRWNFGEKTAASADGRLSGETISQNASATFGTDKEGATAHLISVAQIDASKTPNSTIVDIDLHISAVKGENGIKTLVSTLKTYFDLGGFAVHYNVLDTQVLKDAKKNPEKYPNLQVRLCGWNVLFSTLSEEEKDEFIKRSER